MDQMGGHMLNFSTEMETLKKNQMELLEHLK